MRAELTNDALESNALSWLCVEPMLLSVRGKSMTLKQEVYNQLNEGQQALYMFYAFHNHVKTIPEFYWYSAYYIDELKAWGHIKNGVRFFNDLSMVSLLEKMELLLGSRNREAKLSDLEIDKELYESVREMFEQYQIFVQSTINKMNEYVRTHQDDFIIIATGGDHIGYHAKY